MQRRMIEISVGIFMLAGLAALLGLALKVSGLTQYHHRSHYYTLLADFDNIGGLKERAPVRIAGVRVGEVEAIVLDKKRFKAHALLVIDKKNNNLPADTTASILTEGLLGSNYVSLSPGFDSEMLKEGDEITTTHSAIILENMIGQLLFSVKDKN